MNTMTCPQTSNQVDDDKKILQTTFDFENYEELFTILDENKDAIFLFVDTETSGLGGSKKQQLTQIAALPMRLSITDIGMVFFNIGESEEIFFEQMIYLNDKTKKDLKDPEQRTHYILNELNHYFENIKTKDRLEEQEAIDLFFNWISNLEKKYNREVIIVAQNAHFDIDMIYGRSETPKKEYPYLCTKIVIAKTIIPTMKKLAKDGATEAIEFIEKITKKNKKGRKYVSTSMGALAPAFGINMDNFHDAKTDCEITAKMLTRILNF